MDDVTSSESPKPIDFRNAYCEWKGCPIEAFERRVLAETLFFPARVLRALVRPFRPHAFYSEFLLVKQAGDKQELEDIQLDVDFYQHKYVVGTLTRESFSLRVSGRQLVKLAHSAFRSVRRKEKNQPRPNQVTANA